MPQQFCLRGTVLPTSSPLPTGLRPVVLDLIYTLVVVQASVPAACRTDQDTYGCLLQWCHNEGCVFHFLPCSLEVLSSSLPPRQIAGGEGDHFAWSPLMAAPCMYCSAD